MSGITIPSAGNIISAEDYNMVATFYNQPNKLDTNFALKQQNELIIADDWVNLYNVIVGMVSSRNMSFIGELPDINQFEKSKLVRGNVTWPDVKFNVTPTTLQFTEDGTFTVPNGVYKIKVNWCIGAGGGGSRGINKNFGFGGGGGGTGGIQKDVIIPVNWGDVFNIFVSNTGGIEGHDGNDTWIHQNDIEIMRSTGGKSGLEGNDLPAELDDIDFYDMLPGPTLYGKEQDYYKVKNGYIPSIWDPTYTVYKGLVEFYNDKISQGYADIPSYTFGGGEDGNYYLVGVRLKKYEFNGGLGGEGGLPNGIKGSDGGWSNSIYSFGNGGNGGNSPFSGFGKGGLGNSEITATDSSPETNGLDATNFGSGGGGGGFSDSKTYRDLFGGVDRTWNGGTGFGGFVEIYYDGEP